jgi:drug/metabolite transporter (DMT)-like permease
VLVGLVAALGAAVVYGVAAVLQAIAVRRSRDVRGIDPRLLLDMLRRPVTTVVLVLLGTGFVLHLVSVRLLPLFLAQAGISVSLAVTAAVATAFLGDRLGPGEWAAVAGVVLGLVLLAVASASTGTERGSAATDLALSVFTAGIGVVAAVLARSTGPWPTAGLSALAGAAYAVVGITARLLPAADWWRSPLVLIMSVAGVLGFTLYSVALQRGRVTMATAPMIVLQTVLPSAAGLIILGDQVRDGGEFLVAVGLLCVLVSAVVLIKVEDRLRDR